MVGVQVDEVRHGPPDRIGRALEPVGGLGRLLGGDDVDERLREVVEAVGLADVPVERRGIELRQHEDAPDAGVQAVADGDVDEPVLAADRHGRLGAAVGEGVEALALPAAQDDRQNVRHACLPSRSAAVIARPVCPTAILHIRPPASTWPCGRPASAFLSTARCGCTGRASASSWPGPRRSPRRHPLHDAGSCRAGCALRVGEARDCRWSAASTRSSRSTPRCSADRAGSAGRCAIYQRWAYGRCGTSAGAVTGDARACSSTPASAPIGCGCGRAASTRAPSRRRRAPRRSEPPGAPGRRCRSWPTPAGCRARRASTLLPEISQSLRAHGQPHRLLFIGDGPMRAELQAACPGAIFTGRVAHEHVPALLASADVFCVSEPHRHVRQRRARGAGLRPAGDRHRRRRTARGGAARRDRLDCGSRGPFTLAVALSWLLREPRGGRRWGRGAASRGGAELAAGARAAVRRVARGASRRRAPSAGAVAPTPSDAMRLGCKA